MKAITNYAIKFLKMIIMPVFVYVLMLILAPRGFGTPMVLKIVLTQALIPTMLGYGMCFTQVAGLNNLGGGAIVISGAMFGGSLGVQFGLPGLILGSVLAGLLMGMITGGVYTVFKIPSLVVSIGIILVFEVISFEIVGAYLTIPTTISFLGKYPYNVFIVLGGAVLFYFMYYKTKFSCHLRAVGSEELLAKTMGVKTEWIKFLAFAVSGLFFGITAFLQVGYAGGASAVSDLSSLSTVFQPLIGVMVAMAMRKIYNLAIGVFVTSFSVSLLFNGLIAMGLPDTMQNVVLGIFLILVLAFTSYSEVITKYIQHFRVFFAKTQRESVKG